MQDNLIKKILVIPLVLVLGISFLGLAVIWYVDRDVPQAEAEYYDKIANPTGDNVSGFAWGENYGWVSFNSSNCDSTIPPNNSTDTGNFPCPNTPQPTRDYGVSIEHDNDYIVSGHAWSSNLGWISFNNEAGYGATTPPGGFGVFNGNCENLNLCNQPGDGCTACYDPDTELLYGWAKVLALGDDGWIRLDDDDTLDAFDYGVTIDLATHEASGFAWGGSDLGADNVADVGPGWISFSCNDIADCTWPYQVIAQVNVRPEVDPDLMTAPNWGSNEACETNDIYVSGTGEALGVRLGWRFDDPGDTQIAYHIVLNELGPDVIDTGKCTAIGVCSADCGNNPTGSLCFIDPNCIDCEYPINSSYLTYNQRYRWEVNVWDSFDMDIEGGAVNYSTSSDTHNDDTFASTFRTYDREFPRPYIDDWFPHNPSKNEDVMYWATSTSYCYSTDTTLDPMCLTGDMKWNWDRVDNPLYSTITAPTPNDSYDASTTITTFIQPGRQTGIQVELYDATNLDISCSTSTTNDSVKLELPNWRESR